MTMPAVGQPAAQTLTEIDGFAIERAPDFETLEPIETPAAPATPPAAEPAAVVPPVTPAPETPAAPSTPETPATPETPVTPAGPELPEWISDIKPEERTDIAHRLYWTLSPEERAKVAGDDLVAVQGNTAAQVRGDFIRQQNEALRNEHVVSLDERFGPHLDEEVREGFGPALASFREIEGVRRAQAELREGVKAVMNAAGVTTLPAEVLKAAGEAATPGDAAAVYMHHFLSLGWQGGETNGSAKANTAAKADAAANRSRTRNEVMGDLHKEGRIRIGQDDNGFFAELVKNAVAPSLGAETISGAAGLSPEAYAQMNERHEDIDPSMVDAFTAQYAQMQG